MIFRKCSESNNYTMLYNPLAMSMNKVKKETMMDKTKNRLSEGMKAFDVIIVMADKNPMARSCITKMLLQNSPEKVFEFMYVLDSFGIYGEKLYILWHNCCCSNMKKFQQTIQAFRDGKFMEEEIQQNLSDGNIRPFV